MTDAEERDLRGGYFYDGYVRGFDSDFWNGDTAGLLTDTVRGGIKIGDTALVGSMSSFSQYLYGDFEFAMNFDSTVPDSNDSVRFFGLRNQGDTTQRGAVYFDLSYDTTAGDSSDTTRYFSVVAYDEAGNRTRRPIQWDTNWSGGGRTTRFRLVWEEDGYRFLINDTVYQTIAGLDSNSRASIQVNTSIPQALRVSKRSADTTDTSSTLLKFLNIRNARKIL